jgi:hypothetical protein
MCELETANNLLRRQVQAACACADARQNKLNLIASFLNTIPEPSRTFVIDALANGQLLPDADGARYGKVFAEARKAKEGGG